MVEAAELQQRFHKRNKIAHTTEELLKHLTGYPVKSVRSFYPKDMIPEEWIPDMDDDLIKSFIIGSAWPNNIGWELCYAEDTIFGTEGFNDYDPLFFFKVSPNFEIIPVDPTTVIDGVNDHKYHIHSITYSDLACLDIMTLKDNKPN